MKVIEASGMITRVDVAGLLGVSRSMVRKLEAAGKLHPILSQEGINLFSREEVVDFARRRGKNLGEKIAGKLAAQAFELFESGATLPQIVMQLGISPGDVRRLWGEYNRPLERPKSPLVEAASAEVSELLAGIAKKVAAERERNGKKQP
jgi:hypothetical protein